MHARVLFAGALLVGVLVVTGYTSAVTFAQVSRAMGAASRDDREAAGLLSTLASAIEDEDDVVLMSLSGDLTAAREAVSAERTRFDRARSRLDGITTDGAERAILAELSGRVAAYRRIVDVVLPLGGSDRARELYRQDVAPIVRQGTALCGRLRESRFRATQQIAGAARDEAHRAMVVVSLTSVVSLALLFLIAWHVARSVREVLSLNGTLEAALEALPEVVLVVDRTGSIVRMNGRAQALFVEWLGAVPRSVDDVPLPGLSQRLVARVIAGEKSKSPSRADLGRSIPLEIGLETRRFSLRILPVSGTPKTPAVEAVVVLDDVTEFARLDEMRTEFIAAASHELRTPLTTLQMTLALLAEQSSTLSPAMRETIATAELGSGQLSATVDEFLDLAVLDAGTAAGTLGYERTGIDVASWLGQVTHVLEPRFEERGLALHSNVAGGSVTVEGDLRRLSTALSNVLTNALKYSPSGGAVCVGAVADAGKVEITVDDEGPGVSESLRDRIFEKYFRVEHERSRHGAALRSVAHGGAAARGAGIGLYLCRQIIEAHGGAARCEVSPRGGTRIRLTLPMASAEA